MIWVVIFNSIECRIYNYKKQEELRLLKEIQHPENKLRDIELTSDKPGHYKTNLATRGTYVQRTDPKEIKIEEFVREIAKELEHGRGKNFYENLILISPPHVGGLLSQHLNKHVKELVRNNIHKDIISLPDQELINFLHTYAKYPDQ
jgi:protein required for attachment to host cells